MSSTDEGAAVAAEPSPSTAGVVVGDTALSVVALDELPTGDDDAGLDLARWAGLAVQALRTEGVAAGELNLVFVDAEAMASLNEEHMGGVGPTDVLAFPIDGGELPAAGDSTTGVGDGVPVLLGDVIVCPAVARRSAGDRGRRVDDELALLIVHGVLHVLGHDHAEPAETERMQAREQALLAAHHRP